MKNVCEVKQIGNDHCVIITVPLSDMAILPTKLAIAQATFPDIKATTPAINPADQTCSSRADFGQNLERALKYVELINSLF